MDKIPITPEGYQKKVAELRHLKSVERPNNIEEIREARAHGDLSENAEYEAAKDRQALINARIEELEDRIARMEVIDPTKISSDRIVFGAVVTLYDAGEDIEKVYQIVGEDETDIANGRISVQSPIARALIGKMPDDEVEVVTPGGKKHFVVADVAYRTSCQKP